MWIPFELGQTVYIVIDRGWEGKKTVQDPSAHIGPRSHYEYIHHPVWIVEARKFDFDLLANWGINRIFTNRVEAEKYREEKVRYG